MDIGNNLREIRQSLKITQADLSRMAGIKQPTISAIENGINKPAIETLLLISQALGCTVSDLVGDAVPKPKMDDNADYLLSIYSQLNETGQSLLISQAESILQQPALRKKDSTRSVV